VTIDSDKLLNLLLFVVAVVVAMVDLLTLLKAVVGQIPHLYALNTVVPLRTLGSASMANGPLVRKHG
jgi:hypothetical protein